MPSLNQASHLGGAAGIAPLGPAPAAPRRRPLRDAYKEFSRQVSELQREKKYHDGARGTYMIRCLLSVAVLVAVGSFNLVHSLPVHPSPAGTRVISVAADGSSKVLLQAVKDADFVGRYGCGDGLGFNLSLVLKEGRKFDCTWSGCLGVYGTTSGEWTVDGAGIKLVPQKADGMFKTQPLGRLRIISFQDHFLLLQERDIDWFNKYGPDTVCCFHGSAAAHKALDKGRIPPFIRGSEKK